MKSTSRGALAILLALALVVSPSSLANEKKPTKENPGIGNSGSKSPNSAAEKVQEPVPAPTPTSQPVEVAPKSNNSAPSKSDSTESPTVVTASTPKPEPAKSEAPKPEPAKSEAPKPEPSVQANKSSPESTVSTSTTEKVAPKERQVNTAALSREMVVNPSVFKNQRLVAGKFAPGLANSAAKKLEIEDADENCGVSEKAGNIKAATAKSNATAKKETASSKAATSAKNQKTSSASSANQNAASVSDSKKPAKEPAEECKDFILVFSDDASGADIEGAANESKSKVLKAFSNVFKGAVVNGPPSKIFALAKNPKVQSIELDGLVSTQEIYSNPVWGLDRSDQRDLPLDSIYDDLGNGGFTIPVYVVDTGIYAEHSEFLGRVAAGATSIVDGYGTWDCNGHGTHVAGTIAGTKFGIAKLATLIPVRVLDCSGSGSYSGVIAGLDWIASNHPAGVPGIVNMSLGGPASSSLDSAVNNLISRGLTVVVAAGNSGADACNYSPARVPAAITVAAIASDDARANYSNYGTCVDVFAPGSSIISAWINGSTGSALASGTSMASPHVAGAIARFLYINPSSSPYQTANSLNNSASIDLVRNAGAGTPNRLLFIDIAFDETTEPVTSTKPSKSRKTSNQGKGNKP